jgi:hypothetical protein
LSVCPVNSAGSTSWPPSPKTSDQNLSSFTYSPASQTSVSEIVTTSVLNDSIDVQYGF